MKLKLPEDPTTVYLVLGGIGFLFALSDPLAMVILTCFWTWFLTQRVS